MNDLPKELKKQMGGVEFRDPDRPYTTHDLVLSYISYHTAPPLKSRGVSANDLLEYVWLMTGKVASRGYIYRVLTTLRQRGHITTKGSHKPGKARNFSTGLGRHEARPYKENDK